MKCDSVHSAFSIRSEKSMVRPRRAAYRPPTGFARQCEHSLWNGAMRHIACTTPILLRPTLAFCIHQQRGHVVFFWWPSDRAGAPPCRGRRSNRRYRSAAGKRRCAPRSPRQSSLKQAKVAGRCAGRNLPELSDRHAVGALHSQSRCNQITRPAAANALPRNTPRSVSPFLR